MHSGSESASGESARRDSQHYSAQNTQRTLRTSTELDNASRSDLNLLANIPQLLALILRNLPAITPALVLAARDTFEHTDVEAEVEEDFDCVGAVREGGSRGDGELVGVERVGEGGRGEREKGS